MRRETRPAPGSCPPGAALFSGLQDRSRAPFRVLLSFNFLGCPPPPIVPLGRCFCGRGDARVNFRVRRASIVEITFTGRRRLRNIAEFLDRRVRGTSNFFFCPHPLQGSWCSTIGIIRRVARTEVESFSPATERFLFAGKVSRDSGTPYAPVSIPEMRFFLRARFQRGNFGAIAVVFSTRHFLNAASCILCILISPFFLSFVRAFYRCCYQRCYCYTFACFLYFHSACIYVHIKVHFIFLVSRLGE